MLSFTKNFLPVPTLSKVIKDRFALMMGRENSQVINQPQFYRSDDVHEGRNLSVGKRVLADILNAMTEQATVDIPIILARVGTVVLMKKVNFFLKLAKTFKSIQF